MRALRPPIVNGRWLVWRYYLSMLAVAVILVGVYPEAIGQFAKAASAIAGG